MLEFYGVCAKIPDGDTIDYLMCNFLDCYIDLWQTLCFLVCLMKICYLLLLKVKTDKNAWLIIILNNEYLWVFKYENPNKTTKLRTSI
jgi:hypothetical protein